MHEVSYSQQLFLLQKYFFICSENYLKKKAGILLGVSVNDSQYEQLEDWLKLISGNRDLVSNQLLFKQYHIFKANILYLKSIYLSIYH